MLKVLLHFNFKVIVMHMYNSENVLNPPGHWPSTRTVRTKAQNNNHCFTKD